jgi:hypothetical protein
MPACHLRGAVRNQDLSCLVRYLSGPLVAALVSDYRCSLQLKEKVRNGARLYVLQKNPFGFAKGCVSRGTISIAQKKRHKENERWVTA